MNFIKYLLIIVGLLTLGFLGYMIFGFVIHLLWYAVVIGAVAAIGYGGYRLLKKSDAPQLEGKKPIAIKEMENTDRALEEYKRKYLPK